jgi:hypothetical protein
MEAANMSRLTTTRLIAATVVAFIACGSPPERASASASASAAASPSPHARPQSGKIDPEQLLAPIALYPDQLLAQMLMSAGDPAKVTELNQWLTKNGALKGSDLQDAAVKAGFEPSFVALALFPKVVAAMAANIDKTTLLGQLFIADRNAVFTVIQRLRHQAQNVGTLKSTPQQDVKTETTSTGQEVIVIEPSNPQVVYVPQYNTQTVYTQAPTTTTTVVVHEDDDDASEAMAAGMIGFTAGIAMGAAFNSSYYYGPHGWYGGGYMYNDGWDDYYDAREDAREDWQDHREDLSENRGEQRTERTESRTERTGERSGQAAQQRTERQQSGQTGTQSRTQAGTQATQSRTQPATSRTGSTESRGYSDRTRSQSAGQQRSMGGSDAFSGYSRGSSQRAASSRGAGSRSSSRGGGRRR